MPEQINKHSQTTKPTTETTSPAPQQTSALWSAPTGRRTTRPTSPADIISLQRTIGNHATSRFLKSSAKQSLITSQASSEKLQRQWNEGDDKKLTDLIQSMYDYETESELLEELYAILRRKYPSLNTARECISTEYEKLVQLRDEDNELEELEKYTFGELLAKDGFEVAKPGKKLGSEVMNFETLKERVFELIESGTNYTSNKIFNAQLYKEKIETFKYQDLIGYRKLANCVKPFLSIKQKTLSENQNITDKILELFSWLKPLQDEVIKGINDKEGLMKNMQILLIENIELLQVIEGAPATPKKAFIKHEEPITIQGHKVGQQSEIVTGPSGAKMSGERTESGRTVENLLGIKFKRKFVAGHLVADSIGGKNQDYNLAPMTNEFNTSGYGMEPSEKDARIRLKQNKVIHYKTTVQYENQGENDITAALPTNILIEVSTLTLKKGGDGEKIEDYEKGDNQDLQIYMPNIGDQINK